MAVTKQPADGEDGLAMLESRTGVAVAQVMKPNVAHATARGFVADAPDPAKRTPSFQSVRGTLGVPALQRLVLLRMH